MILKVSVIFHIRLTLNAYMKVNDGKCLIYEVKLYMCEAIYIDNIKQTFKKIMDVNFSDLLRLLKNRQK